jgi:hypothetical protein
MFFRLGLGSAFRDGCECLPRTAGDPLQLAGRQSHDCTAPPDDGGRGRHGPELHRGDVIDAEHVAPDEWRYWSTVQTVHPWTRSIPNRRIRIPENWVWQIRKGRAARLLERLTQLGAWWSAALGDLTVSGYLGEGETELSAEIQELIAALHEIL